MLNGGRIWTMASVAVASAALVAVMMLTLSAQAAPTAARKPADAKAADSKLADAKSAEAKPAAAKSEAGPPTLVLSTWSSWRSFYTLKPPVIALDSGLKPILFPQRWLNGETAEPPAGWMKPEFNDGEWVRGSALAASRSGYTSRACLRSSFEVTDPAKVQGLALTVVFHGGAIVYLNGVQLACGYLPKNFQETSLAESYSREAFAPAKGTSEKAEAASHERSLKDVAIPANLLKKGVNVIAIEIVRAPYHKVVDETRVVAKEKGGEDLYVLSWNTCELRRVVLTAARPDGLVPNSDRPPTLQVWNSDVLAPDSDVDFGNPNEPLRPITIVAARNGWYSGKVVLGSTKAIRNLVVTPGELKGEPGGAIPAAEIKVRYGLRWEENACVTNPGTPYPAAILAYGALAESPLKEFEVLKPQSRRYVHGLIPTEGAIVPVWVTVRVPADARPGTYTGQVKIAADGEAPLSVPLKVTVADWKLPDPQNYQTWIELIQSPDTLAVEYGLPLWSEKHWQMIGQSFTYLNRIGSRVLYVPLLAHTNLGNEESMVRWVEKGNNEFDFDYSIMEKYLDLALKQMGTPKLVIFNVWDVYLIPKQNSAESGGYSGHRRMVNSFEKEQTSKLGTGPLVTVVDPKTGKTENAYLPRYEDPTSKALWQKLFAGLRERLKSRGLEKAMMLGTVTDARPTKSDVQFFKDFAPDLPWASEGHGGFEPGQLLQDIAKVEYQTRVWMTKFADEVATHGNTWGVKERLYGWQLPYLMVDFERAGGLENYPPTRWRHFAETNITGGQRGVGRLAGDFWNALKDKQGRRQGTISFRYPESLWMNLNIVNPTLAPGPDGPVATHYYEAFREGVQECEARIFIEQVLTDPVRKARLGDELATRAQLILDERMPIMWRCLSNLGLIGSRWGDARLWRWTPGVAGHFWFISSGWQERSEKLYSVAGEIEKKVGGN